MSKCFRLRKLKSSMCAITKRNCTISRGVKLKNKTAPNDYECQKVSYKILTERHRAGILSLSHSRISKSTRKLVSTRNSTQTSLIKQNSEFQ